MKIPTDTCGICYHPKSEATTCNHPECSLKSAEHPLIRLRTTCGRGLWAGFFGVNANGDQPECLCEVIEDIEEDSVEYDADGSARPCYAVECPSCGGLLEWPQEWEVIWPAAQHCTNENVLFVRTP